MPPSEVSVTPVTTVCSQPDNARNIATASALVARLSQYAAVKYHNGIGSYYKLIGSKTVVICPRLQLRRYSGTFSGARSPG